MSLRPGTYKLRLAADPSPLVGVVSPDVQPVVTRGQNNVWRVEKSQGEIDGLYRLFIVLPSGEELNIQVTDGGQLVGNLNPPETDWIITGPEGGPYEIHTLLLSSVWTVQEPDVPFSPVILDDLQSGPPEKQKWYFVSPDAQ